MSTRTIPLARPLPERLLVDAWTALRDAWQERATRRRLERELDAVADMNEALLRDIGAPDWMVEQAQVRRDADRMRLIELNMGLQRHE